MERETSPVLFAEHGKGNRHKVSAAALHAARVILKNFDISKQPGQKVEPSVDSVARIIDYATGLPQMLPALQWFVKENPWYEPRHLRHNGEGRSEYVDTFVDWVGEGRPQFDKAKRLEERLEQLRYSVRHIEMAYENVPRLETRGIPCGAAWNAARNLCKLFKFERRWRVAFTMKNLALFIDTSANCFRVQRAVEGLVQEINWQDPAELRRNIETLRKGMKVAELAINIMPEYSAGSLRVIATKPELHPQRSVSQTTEVNELREKLNTARTDLEEQKVLRDWRKHTHGNS